MSDDVGTYIPTFEAIRHSDQTGEYWMARELMPVLGYTGWQRAVGVIKKAIAACEEVGDASADHFNTSVKMVEIGSNTTRSVADYRLTRYAAYLVAMNADPRGRPQIAAAQKYFAYQTRRMELHELREQQEKRLAVRERVSEGNKRLAESAQDVGVTGKDFGAFQDAGYTGLYGMGLEAVKGHKNIPIEDDLLDREGHVALAANELRIALTDTKLRQGGISGADAASTTHRQVGRSVRRTVIQEIGIAPENLPAEPSIKPLIEEKRRKKKKTLPPPKSQDSLF